MRVGTHCPGWDITVGGVWAYHSLAHPAPLSCEASQHPVTACSLHRNVDPPVWYDTDVKLFEIQRV